MGKIESSPLDLLLMWILKEYVLIATCLYRGARGDAIASGTALQAERSRVRFSIMQLEFFVDIILQAAFTHRKHSWK
jgi:hypothetical protein